MRPSELANIVWSLAQLKLVNETLLDAISSRALQIHEYDAQDIAQTAWAFAKFAIKDCPMLESLAAASLRTISLAGPRDIAGMAWSFATLAYVD